MTKTLPVIPINSLICKWCEHGRREREGDWPYPPPSLSLSITHFTCLSHTKHYVILPFSISGSGYHWSLPLPLFRLFTSLLIPSFLPIDYTLFPLPCPISLMNGDARREDKGEYRSLSKGRRGGINKGGLVTSSVIVWIHILDMPSRESSSPLSSCLSTSQVIFPRRREGGTRWVARLSIPSDQSISPLPSLWSTCQYLTVYHQPLIPSFSPHQDYPFPLSLSHFPQSE